MTGVRSVSVLTQHDTEAGVIGRLYGLSRMCLVDSVKYAHQCGTRLKAKKASLGHGQWLPWLEANAEVLGFESRFTAAKLMKLANVPLTAHLSEGEAIALSRQAWGNTDPEPDDELPSPPPAPAFPTISPAQLRAARLVRDAERAEPGIVRRTVEAAVAAGKSPTKAMVRRACELAVRREQPSPAPPVVIDQEGTVLDTVPVPTTSAAQDRPDTG